MRFRVAIVGRDPHLRMCAARSFDSAPPEWQIKLFEDEPDGAHVSVFCPDVEGAGIRFDPQEPGSALERVRENLSHGIRGRAVHVAGTGGGVGTTSVAIHLAAALGRRSSTCLVELDPNEGLADRLGLDVDPPGWDEVTTEADAVVRAAVPIGGFRALLRPGGLDVQNGGRFLDAAARRFTFTVVDAGGLSSQPVDNPALLVMPPSLPAARRARTFLDERPDETWAVVTNRLGPGSEVTRAMIEGELGRSLLLELPCAPALRDAEDENRLLSLRWSRWLRRIDRVADLVAG